VFLLFGVQLFLDGPGLVGICRLALALVMAGG
jgi:hypothetical protein